MPGKCPYLAELRRRAVRMVAEVRPDYPTEWATINAVATKLGIGTAETLRTWVRQAQIDEGSRPGRTSDESAELKRLRRENAELRRANEILKAASLDSKSQGNALGWGSVAEALAGAVVQSGGQGVEVGLAVQAQMGAALGSYKIFVVVDRYG
jgi:transposase